MAASTRSGHRRLRHAEGRVPNGGLRMVVFRVPDRPDNDRPIPPAGVSWNRSLELDDVARGQDALPGLARPPPHTPAPSRAVLMGPRPAPARGPPDRAQRDDNRATAAGRRKENLVRPMPLPRPAPGPASGRGPEAVVAAPPAAARGVPFTGQIRPPPTTQARPAGRRSPSAVQGSSSAQRSATAVSWRDQGKRARASAAAAAPRRAARAGSSSRRSSVSVRRRGLSGL